MKPKGRGTDDDLGIDKPRQSRKQAVWPLKPK